MGLSGRKQKQRIPNDPRNLAWADDAARFGSSYLSKFGWDSSKGLGVNGEGRTTHIKVAQKLDMMGIGAAHMKDPNGIAWKQNRDFENLLKRLNDSSGQAEVEVNVEESRLADVEVEAESVVPVGEEEGKKKKKKKEKKDKEKKKDKDSKKDKKRKRDEREDASEKKKKRRKTSEEPQKGSEDAEMKESLSSTPAPPAKPVHRFRSHRARAIAAKSISSKSSVHISEILGIAPTPTTSSESPSGSATPAEGKLTQISDVPELEKITTSTKSVADYFKEKLSLKMSSKSASPASASTPGSEATSPGPDRDYEDERPMGGLGFSRLRFEVRQDSQVEEETVRMGLSKFSSLMSSSFLSATANSSVMLPSSIEDTPDVEQEIVPDGGASRDSDEEESKEERKRRKKEKKEKKNKKKAEADSKEEKKNKKKKKAKEEEDLDGGKKSTKKKRKSEDHGA